MTEKTEQQSTQDAGTAGPFSGVVTFVVGGLLGLIVLVYVTTSTKPPATGDVQELPHLTLMVGFPTLEHPEVRKRLIRAHEQLLDMDVVVLGPKNFPILVPGENPGDLPDPKNLDDLTEEDWARAKPYLGVGGWLIPQVYTPELDAAIFRVAPPGRKGFPSGTLDRVIALAESLGDMGEVSVYCRALGGRGEDPQARSRINLTFGVQTANVFAYSESGSLSDPNVLIGIQKQADEKRLASEHPLIRGIVTTASFWAYAYAVTAQKENASLTGEGAAPNLEQLQKLTRMANVPELISPDGKSCAISVTTEAEGEDNPAVANHVAGNLEAGDLQFTTARRRN